MILLPSVRISRSPVVSLQISEPSRTSSLWSFGEDGDQRFIPERGMLKILSHHVLGWQLMSPSKTFLPESASNIFTWTVRNKSLFGASVITRTVISASAPSSFVVTAHCLRYSFGL
jgi:hypothetical protein